jgi:hypothetical protein
VNKLQKALVSATATLAVGLGAVAVSSGPADAALAHPCYAKAIYGNGPGTGVFGKNYRAYDAWCDGNGNYGGDWFGPWRLKKSSAQNDAKAHNARFN